MTRTSAIIPAYNCSPFLRRAVDSLLATGLTDLEVVIVDDGSQDDTFAIGRRLAQDNPGQVFIHHHLEHANRGVSASRNLGIERSTGDLICFLDGDDFVYPHRFKTSLPLIENDSTIDAVYEMTRIEPSGAKPLEKCFGDTGIFGLDHPINPDQLLPTLLSNPIWHANSVLIRRSLLARTGVFSESLRTAEDCHLWYRMASLGRLVPGNFDVPVSCYCRREGSLFRPSWEARQELMRAMGEFARWLQHVDVPDAVRKQAFACIAQFFQRAITEARRSGNTNVARQMAWHAMRQFPPLLRDLKFWRQAAHIALAPVRIDPISRGINPYELQLESVQEYPVIHRPSPGDLPVAISHHSVAPRISAIVPAFNCEKYLRRAVESLLGTKQPNLEIIIIDDGSSDQTLELARQLCQEHPQSVSLYYHPGHANLGVSATRNVGIQQCTGDYVCFLDADDYVYPHRFANAVAILNNQPNVDGVHELAEMAFESPEAAAQWWAHGAPFFGFSEPIPPDRILSKLLRGVCWATSAIVVRKTLLAKAGLFDTSLPIAEDCNLWFRLAFSGTLVSGDLTHPVSAYWRHARSAFRPDAGNRVYMIRAMTSFYDWAKQKHASNEQLALIKRDVTEYVLQGLMSARGMKQRALAWKMACGALSQMPTLAFNELFRGHIARMALGR